MEYFDKLISNIITDILKPDELVFQLIERKLNANGIILTEEQKIRIKDDLRQKDFAGLQINLSEEQEKIISDLHNGHLVIDLDNNKELEEFETKIQSEIKKATQETVRIISDSLLKEWKSQAKSLLEVQETERKDYTQLIYKIWGKPLGLLDILLSVSLEAGAKFNQYYRSDAIDENDLVFEAMTRLHARGCQVGAEALLLLKNGFADGAHARWRTLHEICVEALFIFQNGISVAEQFLYHYQISDYQRAIQYKEHHRVLGYGPPKQIEIDAVKKRRDELINRYGRSFGGDYGWSAQVLNMKRPTFADLEKSVKLDYLRPFYKLANINVHSGSKGAQFRLGLPITNDDVLVAGASIFGLGEPGQNMAFSLNLLTATLLRTKENLDRIAFITATDQLKNEIFWAFDEIMEKQENNKD